MSDNKQKLVIVGGGMAAVKLLEELFSEGCSHYSITLISKEDHLPYNRIQLSQLLSGDVEADNIQLKDQHWYFSNKVTLVKGVSVVAIARNKKQIELSDKALLNYDTLVLCTGSNPAMIPVPGGDLKGVCAFRTLQDVDYFMSTAAQKKHAVVIGGGLLGIEAASGLQQQGMQVSLIHIGEYLMDNQLDAKSAEMLKDSLQRRGINCYLHTQTQTLLGEDRVTAVQFADGQKIKADLVVMAVGVRPNIELAQAAQLQCERGIVVNDSLISSDKSIYAFGECAQHRGRLFGLVAPIYQQAKVLAQQLCGTDDARYQGSMNYTKLKVSGIDVFSAGDICSDNDAEELVYFDAAQQVYKKFFLRDDKLVGMIIYGLACDTSWYLELIQNETDVNAFRNDLLFGKSFVDKKLLNSEDAQRQTLNETDEEEIYDYQVATV